MDQKMYGAKTEIGQNIRFARRLKGLKQKELAQKLNMSTNFICSVENGKAMPSLLTVAKIVEILSVSVSSLLVNDPVLDVLKDLAAKYDIDKIAEGVQLIKEKTQP